MSGIQPNASLATLLSELRANRKKAEAAFEQLNKATGDLFLGHAADPEVLHALVDRCEFAYVDAVDNAEEAACTLLQKMKADGPISLEAMDTAVDRLASTEASTLAAFGVLDATVRQLVASIQTDDAPARTAGFVSDTLQALALAGQQLETYHDAADDVVVTAGAAIGAMQLHHAEPAPPACHESTPAYGALPAFDTALEALIHATEGVGVAPELFEAEFEQRFAACPDALAWGRPIFAVMRERLHGNGGLCELVDGLVAAAADALDGLGAHWRDGHGITVEAVAQSGGITCAFLNARERQRHRVQGQGG